MRRIIIFGITILVLTLAAGSLFLISAPTPVYADDPCYSVETYTLYLDHYVGFTGTGHIEDEANALGVPGELGVGDYALLWDTDDPNWSCAFYSLDGTITGTILIDSVYYRGTAYRGGLMSHPDVDQMSLVPMGTDDGWEQLSLWQYELDTPSTGRQIGSLGFCTLVVSWPTPEEANSFYGTAITVTGEYCPSGGAICSTVDDYHFTDPITATPWLLDNATITTSTLTLPAGGIAYQHLSTLQSNANYSAVVSVTSILTASEIPLIVRLGTQTDTSTATTVATTAL